jgi:hypothetical protein
LDIEEQNIIDLDDLTANHIDDIDALQELTASHTEDITALETLTASHTTDITALETLTASHTADITALETLTASHTADILTKLDTINDGDLTIAKTDGLLTALNSTAKLDSANTFTGLQTVNGDLKADHVLVKITAPTLNTHLTSKLYVDTALIGKQNTLTASSDVTMNALTANSATITGNTTISGVLTAPNQPCFKAKVLNTASISINNNVAYNGIVIDTDEGYSTTNNEYTIQSAGTWYFYYGFFSQGADGGYTASLQQNAVVRDEVRFQGDVAIFDSIEAKGMVILPCSIGDVIRVRVTAGTVRVGSALEFHSFGGFRIG